MRWWPRERGPQLGVGLEGVFVIGEWIDWIVERLDGADRDAVALAFFGVWGLVIVTWIALDWLGNPNRGTFRPQGPRRGRGLIGRWRATWHAREVSNTEVRETLRTAYGRSSLRLRWSPMEETTTTAYDEARLPEIPRILDPSVVVVKRPPVLTDEFAPIYDDEDDTIDLRDRERADGNDADRWRIGRDPLLPIGGRPPSRRTVRSRTWKNLAATGLGGVGDSNVERARKGTPPRRWNPVVGRLESARLSGNNGTTAVAWSHAGIDPFLKLRDLDDD